MRVVGRSQEKVMGCDAGLPGAREGPRATDDVIMQTLAEIGRIITASPDISDVYARFAELA